MAEALEDAVWERSVEMLTLEICARTAGASVSG